MKGGDKGHDLVLPGRKFWSSILVIFPSPITNEHDDEADEETDKKDAQGNSQNSSIGGGEA